MFTVSSDVIASAQCQEAVCHNFFVKLASVINADAIYMIRYRVYACIWFSTLPTQVKVDTSLLYS